MDEQFGKFVEQEKKQKEEEKKKEVLPKNRLLRKLSTMKTLLSIVGAPGLEDQDKLKKETTGPTPKYKLHVSNASIDLCKLKGFIFCGVSSRFWAMRKHLNSISQLFDQTSKMPFFAWQCITLILEEREVDLVIKD